MRAILKQIPQISWTCMALLLIAPSLRAGTVLRYESADQQGAISVKGTSTLHDWVVKGSEIKGHAIFYADVPPDASAQVIKEAIIANPQTEVDVTIRARSLKSDDKAMDKKMYEALKEKKHPSIQYRLTKIEVPEDTDSSQATFDVQTTGELTVAGAKRELVMPMTLQVVDDQHLKITGQTSLKMTDFKMTPPEAMLGLIKSGDKVEVKFEWNTVRKDEPEAKAS